MKRCIPLLVRNTAYLFLQLRDCLIQLGLEVILAIGLLLDGNAGRGSLKWSICNLRPDATFFWVR